MLSDSIQSSSSISDPFNLGSLTPTTSRTTTRTTARTTSTTLFDENGDPIDPATATDGTLPTGTNRLGAGGALTTADTLGRRTAAPEDAERRDVRGRGAWAGWNLPRETGGLYERR